ncbi:MAG: hypothetical protein CM1200mP2_55560 [Planctomycetaceae bacterium]|nr:MAG: hypothetical protein CM1200mP2_55560 [Planctomycetaceae bacterium]
MADAHKLKQTLNRTTNDQKFGQIDSPKVEKWSKELQEGSTDNLKKELESIKKDLEKLSKLDGDNSPEAQEKRSELAQRMQKKLRDIQSFASEKLDDKHPLTAALKRAKQQMKAMQSGEKGNSPKVPEASLRNHGTRQAGTPGAVSDRSRSAGTGEGDRNGPHGPEGQ